MFDLMRLYKRRNTLGPFTRHIYPTGCLLAAFLFNLCEEVRLADEYGGRGLTVGQKKKKKKKILNSFNSSLL